MFGYSCSYSYVFMLMVTMCHYWVVLWLNNMLHINLQVLGDVEGFEEAVRNIIRDARFDCDVIVSVFETNIRILGWVMYCFLFTFLKRGSLGIIQRMFVFQFNFVT